MRVLGIDQSYTSCALVEIDTETNQVLYFRTINTSPENGNIIERAIYIASLIRTIVLYEVSADKVVIEGLSFGQMIGNATRDLAGLLFLIYEAVTGINIPISIVSPTSVKKLASGSGKADKNIMMEALPDDVREMFIAAGYKKTTGLKDLADAYWIARSNELPCSMSLPKKEKKVKRPKKKQPVESVI